MCRIFYALGYVTGLYQLCAIEAISTELFAHQ